MRNTLSNSIFSLSLLILSLLIIPPEAGAKSNSDTLNLMAEIMPKKLWDKIKKQRVFVTFGFASCPDVCPMVLSDISALITKLKKKGVKQNFAVLFITVDPERDTQKVLNDYVENFQSNFYGVSTNQKDLKSLSKAFGVSFRLNKKPGTTQEFYTVDHTALVYLINPAEKKITELTPPLKLKNVEKSL